VKFSCKHKVCNTCIVKLTSFECPFCRSKIGRDLKSCHITAIVKNQKKLKKERDAEHIEALREAQRGHESHDWWNCEWIFDVSDEVSIELSNPGTEIEWSHTGNGFLSSLVAIIRC